jgi:large subunit ribosomal protein L19
VNSQHLLKKIEKEHMQQQDAQFATGDTVAVGLRIREGNKERIQTFQGIVIKRSGNGAGRTFTVRKASGSGYVERIFPLHSPLIKEIKVKRRGKVRRSKLYYLRNRTGKATRIKEKK